MARRGIAFTAMMTTVLRLAAGFALVGAGLAGCGASTGESAPSRPAKTSPRGMLPACADVVRSIPRGTLAVQNANTYPTYESGGAYADRRGVFDADCPAVFGRLPGGGSGIAEVSFTRMTVPSLDGTTRANRLGMIIMGRMRNNVCLSGQVDSRGDPPSEARCYDPSKPLAGRAIIRGDMAVTVAVSGHESANQNAARERQLLESAAQTVMDVAARS